MQKKQIDFLKRLRKVPFTLLSGRVLIYCAGLMSLALGVAFSVNSNLGVSPVNSLPYVVSLISGGDMGKCVIMVFSSYIVVQILLLRKDFQWMNLTQILFSTLFGYFVNFAKWILGNFSIPTYPGKLLMLAVSILFVAVGVCLYMDVKLVNMPMEGMTHAINQKLLPRLAFHDVKVIMDCLVVAIGIGLSLVFAGKVEGIREGTVLCAILVGKVMKPLQKILQPTINMFCFREEG